MPSSSPSPVYQPTGNFQVPVRANSSKSQTTTFRRSGSATSTTKSRVKTWLTRSVTWMSSTPEKRRQQQFENQADSIRHDDHSLLPQREPTPPRRALVPPGTRPSRFLEHVAPTPQPQPQPQSRAHSIEQEQEEVPSKPSPLNINKPLPPIRKLEPLSPIIQSPTETVGNYSQLKRTTHVKRGDRPPHLQSRPSTSTSAMATTSSNNFEDTSLIGSTLPQRRRLRATTNPERTNSIAALRLSQFGHLVSLISAADRAQEKEEYQLLELRRQEQPTPWPSPLPPSPPPSPPRRIPFIPPSFGSSPEESPESGRTSFSDDESLSGATPTARGRYESALGQIERFASYRRHY